MVSGNHVNPCASGPCGFCTTLIATNRGIIGSSTMGVWMFCASFRFVTAAPAATLRLPTMSVARIEKMTNQTISSTLRKLITSSSRAANSPPAR